MKKKYLLIQKVGIAAICLSCALSLSACGNKKSDMENKDPLTGEEQTGSQESGSDENSSENGSSEAGSDSSSGNMEDFNAMINDENTDPNSIMDFINTNIVNAGINDVERLFKGILNFGDDIRNIDFARLDDSRKYMPEDMVAFMDLMKAEKAKPSMIMSDTENRKVINMTLSEMLERAVLFEQHLEKYPNNITTDAASRIYEEIATNAISGGYDKAQGISHFYKGDSDDVVDKESLQYYQKFVTANADTNLGKIVQDYINTLQTNKFQINENLESFYTGLQARLDVNKWANNTTNNGSTSNNSSTNNANGATNNTNTTGNTNAGNNNTSGVNNNNSGTNNNDGAAGANENNAGTNNNEGTTNTDKNDNNSSASNNKNKNTNAADTIIEGTASR